MDLSDVEDKYRYTAGAHAYSRRMLLRIVILAAFDGGLSGRETERRTHTDIGYMYLAGMQKPDFRTINRFKVDNGDLINDAFKMTISVAKERDLVKLNHIAIDGTKIEAKASINNLTDEKQLELLKKILKHSIELDEEEDELLGEKSGNSVPPELIDKESFDKIYDKVQKSMKNDKNEYKLRSSSKNLLKQASQSEKGRKKVLNKIEKIEQELEKTPQKVLSVNDPETRWMKNKKNQWEYDYNLQIGVDDYSGIILSCGLNNHPTDFKELIPQIENIKENIGELPANTQISADNGYSTDRNMEYLEENQLDGYISSRKLSRKLKKYNRKDKPYSKDNFTYDFNKNAYICPEGQILDKIGKYKERKRTVYWTNNCKTMPMLKKNAVANTELEQ